MMKLKDLKENSKNVDVKVTVLGKKTERHPRVKTDNSIHRVVNFIIGDETSTFLLTVWDDEIDRIPIGEMIFIKKAFVSEFAGKLHLNITRGGSWQFSKG